VKENLGFKLDKNKRNIGIYLRRCKRFLKKKDLILVEKTQKFHVEKAIYNVGIFVYINRGW
tara:strand:- start:57 stop:239 length:183 start_codon:yes stop_codon:yes gene_type:complete